MEAFLNNTKLEAGLVWFTSSIGGLEPGSVCLYDVHLQKVFLIGKYKHTE